MSYGSEKVKDWRRRTKSRMVESMGGKCCVCGYNTTESALEFHHLDPSEKEFSLGRVRANIRSWSKLVEELKKCVLVCSNCHKEIHAGVTDVPDNCGKFNDSYTEYKSTVQKEYDLCPICGKLKDVQLSYCSHSCSDIGQRKVARPSKDELEVLIEHNSWVTLGRMFGVSDNAVRKWARKYELI